MKLFLTSCLLLLLVPLVLSNVIAKGQDSKIKVIYDDGYVLSEALGFDFFWFYTYPNPNKTGKKYGNGTSKVNFDATNVAEGRILKLRLLHNSEKPSLDDLSFVVESISGDKGEKCDLAPPLKSLIKKCTVKSGSVRIRELTDEEKSKAQERRQQLASSLEAKKEKQKKLNGTKSDESGEFRMLTACGPAIVIESIGITNFYSNRATDSQGEFVYMHSSNREGNPDTTEKQMWVADTHGRSFAIENLLGTWEDPTCKQYTLKDLPSSCISAELRSLTDEEKSKLDKLKGSN